ncbi:tetratricopeptide repeat protein [Massilia sp. TS11]|uniref:tetratricopeptide repeat protein n=1 Tax=Massilia sp. TS11 TaxID=2908003 RepID=UPI001EDC0A68|nr:tetratricopeptide repeat protein [Massilia sp. TS11]MCG2583607.1 tetratricopeptide repeat protein [Massilia sp. TS11]
MSTLQEQLQAAVALHQSGKLAEARAAYAAVLATEPEQADALHLLGVLCTQIDQDHEQAVTLIDRAIARLPGNATFYANRGISLQHLRRFDAALASYDRAIALKHDYADAWSNRGMILLELKMPEAALASFEGALRFKPNDAQAHFNRANVLKQLRRYEAALAAYDAALAVRPNFPEAHGNRGTLLRTLRRHDEALAAYDRALELRPDYPAALSNRANVLLELQLFEAAEASYDAAIARHPQDPDAHLNKALCLLLAGDFARGWPLYEWRWRSDKHGLRLPDYGLPRLSAEQDPAGQTVLLSAEQGFGDTIQFCRYAALLKARGARVLLHVPSELCALLETLEAADEVIAKRQTAVTADYYCPMLSLPLVFGTTLETIPSSPAYLRADPARVAAWGERLGPRHKPRIGLAWSGNTGNKNDEMRSLSLADVLAALPAGWDYVSLQKDLRQSDAGTLRQHPNMRHFGAELKDFADTAALATHVDLVISVDTSVVHLCGALGLPSWLLLPYAPDWRWLTGRADSPWYPSLRLFRQNRLMRWQSVLDDVGDAVRAAFPAA